MDNAKTQLVDRLKSANNILVTVSRNPSVDQLAACLGLTLLLNKLSKHSVAVFSGQVPSTIEFLKPEETLEKTTDSLRDFIIALDKDKADKLRYKVEDNVVRIFITPYKTSITEKDLEFSQGDFNVDVVIALGVKQQEELDGAITAHGRILHDATVASINLAPEGGVGTINWHDPQASSLSELVTDLSQLLGDKLLDNQIATALLTGIVAETNRFSNDKTSSQTMNASSLLMAAGANQQLVASKLEAPAKPKPLATAKKDEAKGKSDGGMLDIPHDKTPPPLPPTPTPPPPSPPSSSHLQPGGAKLITEPPSLGGTLSANTTPEGLDPVTDPLSMPQAEPPQLANQPQPPQPPPPPVWTPPPTGQPQTLDAIEHSVNSPHVNAGQLDTARDEVNQALQDSVNPVPEPIQALNAQPLGNKLHPDGLPPSIQSPTSTMLPLGPTPPESSDTNPKPAPSPDSLSPTAPPVPPPLPPQYLNNPANAPSQNQQPPAL